MIYQSTICRQGHQQKIPSRCSHLTSSICFPRTVLGESRGRGPRQPRATDREGRDREPGPLADGVAESAGGRLRRRLREEEQPVLRDHQPQLRPETRGGRHRVPGAAEPVLSPEDLRAAQFAAQEQHQLLLGPAGVADERGGGLGGRGRQPSGLGDQPGQGTPVEHHQIQLPLVAGQPHGGWHCTRSFQLPPRGRRFPAEAQQLAQTRTDNGQEEEQPGGHRAGRSVASLESQSDQDRAERLDRSGGDAAGGGLAHRHRQQHGHTGRRPAFHARVHPRLELEPRPRLGRLPGRPPRLAEHAVPHGLTVTVTPGPGRRAGSSAHTRDDRMI